ncbi:hypothetical protein P7C70_g2637, partial [Phenoliferia sp. Uapishka_3]
MRVTLPFVAALLSSTTASVVLHSRGKAPSRFIPPANSIPRVALPPQHQRRDKTSSAVATLQATIASLQSQQAAQVVRLTQFLANEKAPGVTAAKVAAYKKQYLATKTAQAATLVQLQQAQTALAALLKQMPQQLVVSNPKSITSSSASRSTTSSKSTSKSSFKTTSKSTSKSTSSSTFKSSSASSKSSLASSSKSASTITATPTSSASTQTTSATLTPTPGQTGAVLVKTYQGQTFFDDWYYDDFADPTHGSVNFVNATFGKAAQLSYVRSDNVAIIALDRTTDWNVNASIPANQTQFRNSVRIASTDHYNIGSVVIVDLQHIPYGVGLWPAFWMVGPNWPNTVGTSSLFQQAYFAVNYVKVFSVPV